jgi:hypothetical protein
MPELQDVGLHESTANSQAGPIHPSEQSQLGPASASMQVPFTHEMSLQLSCGSPPSTPASVVLTISVVSVTTSLDVNEPSLDVGSGGTLVFGGMEVASVGISLEGATVGTSLEGVSLVGVSLEGASLELTGVTKVDEVSAVVAGSVLVSGQKYDVDSGGTEVSKLVGHWLEVLSEETSVALDVSSGPSLDDVAGASLEDLPSTVDEVPEESDELKPPSAAGSGQSKVLSSPHACSITNPSVAAAARTPGWGFLSSRGRR